MKFIDLKTGQEVFLLIDWESSEGWSVTAPTADTVKSIEETEHDYVVHFHKSQPLKHSKFVGGLASYSASLGDKRKKLKIVDKKDVEFTSMFDNESDMYAYYSKYFLRMSNH